MEWMNEWINRMSEKSKKSFFGSTSWITALQSDTDTHTYTCVFLHENT